MINVPLRHTFLAENGEEIEFHLARRHQAFA